MQRRVIDRLFSLVRPVRRYRCEGIDCGWTGNLSAWPADGDRGSGRRVVLEPSRLGRPRR